MNFILDAQSKNHIIEMLKYESKLRYSKEVQDLYSKGYYENINEITYGTFVENLVQMETLSNFGFNTNQDDLNEYRRIFSKYKNDNDVINSAFYFRLNSYCPFELNDTTNHYNDINLINLDDKKEYMMSTIGCGGKSNRPLVILAGSLT
jgi:hypothetical protein